MNPNVLTVTASQANGTISYSGTTEDGVMAVSCTLYDSAGTNDLDFDSVSVTSNAYSGTFSIAEGNYILSCANYASGTAVSTTLTAATPAPADDSTDSANSPETGFMTAPSPAEDSAVFSAAAPVILATAAVTIFACVLVFKRFRNRNAE